MEKKCEVIESQVLGKLFVAASDLLFLSHGQTNCSHHQINFSLIYVRISSQALVKWEQPWEPSFP